GDVTTGKRMPVPSPTGLPHCPREFLYPVSVEGAVVSFHDPRDGHVQATLQPVPEVAADVVAARPITADARAAQLSGSGEWFITTPEGYFDSSINAARFIKWNLNGVLYPAERYLRRLRRPEL